MVVGGFVPGLAVPAGARPKESSRSTVENRVRIAAMSSEQARGQQVVRLALELQAQDAARAPLEDFAGAVREAAIAEGLPPLYLEKAEAELRRREALALEKAAARRKTARRAGVAVAALLALLAIGWSLGPRVFPAPPAPWADGLEDQTRWSLDVDEGSRAALRWEQEAGRGQVAVVEVERFAGGASAQARANLDGLGVPAELSGYSEVVLEVRGSLPNARLYFEAGPEERWRSPAISLASGWAEHRVALKAFERQVRVGGKWQTTRWAAPTGVTQASVKVGHFINPADAVGDLHLDTLRLE